MHAEIGHLSARIIIEPAEAIERAVPVVGPYSYDPTSDFPHRRLVQWLSLDEWKMPDPEGL